MDIVVPHMGDEALERLRGAARGLRFLVAEDTEAAVKLAGSAEAVYGFNSRALYDAASRLRWVQSGSAGVESYPMGMFRARGIVLTNAKRIYGAQLADHTMALILAFSRQLPFLFDAQRRRVWEDRSRYPPGELDGEVLLVLGLGGTGFEVARRARGFGMRVIATRRDFGAERPECVDEVHPPDSLHELLPRADWVAVCLPLTPRTRGLIGERELGLMKSSAHIVTVTRGGIIDTAALVSALERGVIAGAGLDVTDPEPLPPEHPLWRTKGVIITPHAAGHSPAAGARMLSLLVENTRRFAAGEALLNVVDLDEEY